MNIPVTFEIRHGLKANLPAAGVVIGAPFFCIDTGELFVWDGSTMKAVTGGGGSGDVVVLLSGDATLATNQNVAFCTGTFTVTLPVAPDVKRLYTVTVETGTVTIVPSSGLINGFASVIGTDGYSFGLRYDGTSWRIV